MAAVFLNRLQRRMPCRRTRPSSTRCARRAPMTGTSARTISTWTRRTTRTASRACRRPHRLSGTRVAPGRSPSRGEPGAVLREPATTAATSSARRSRSTSAGSTSTSATAAPSRRPHPRPARLERARLMGGRTPEPEAPLPPPSGLLRFRPRLPGSSCSWPLVANGRPIGSGDARPTERVAASLVQERNLDLDEYPDVDEPFARQTRPHRVSIYPIGSAVLAVPVFLAARAGFVLDETGLALAGKWAASLFSAAAAALLYLAIGRRRPHREAMWTAVVFALGTSVWSTSQARCGSARGRAWPLRGAPLHGARGSGRPLGRPRRPAPGPHRRRAATRTSRWWWCSRSASPCAGRAGSRTSRGLGGPRGRPRARVSLGLLRLALAPGLTPRFSRSWGRRSPRPARLPGQEGSSSSRRSR